MKKIVLFADALKFKPELFEFVSYIAALAPSKITCRFIEPRELDATPGIKTLGGQIYVEEITMSPDEKRELAIKRQQNLNLFREECAKQNIDAIVHSVGSDDFKNLVHETRYADLAIIDPAIAEDQEFRMPSKLAVEILNNAECPVLIAPEVFDRIDQVVLAYDGSKSSVFAIKQFYYQLPELAAKKVAIMHISENYDHKDHSAEAGMFKEWMALHFANASTIELKGDAHEELYKYFMEHEFHSNQLLVTGAFGRSMISNFFKPSSAELVLKAVDIPVFIAHG